MLKLLGPLAAAVVACVAGNASAATAVISGRLISEGPGPKIDPWLALGDTIQASIAFDHEHAFRLGGTNWSLAQIKSLQVVGAGHLMGFSDTFDGEAMATQYLETACDPFDPECSILDSVDHIQSPAVIFEGARIIGLVGTSAPSDYFFGPDYYLGSNVWGWSNKCFRPSPHSAYACTGSGELDVRNTFAISGGTYLSQYETQGFGGVWDFRHAAVVGIPEPSTWTVMIIGFGLVGASLRSRQGNHAHA